MALMSLEGAVVPAVTLRENFNFFSAQPKNELPLPPPPLPTHPKQATEKMANSIQNDIPVPVPPAVRQRHPNFYLQSGTHVFAVCSESYICFSVAAELIRSHSRSKTLSINYIKTFCALFPKYFVTCLTLVQATWLLMALRLQRVLVT
jgi:hypothetical protein